MSIWGRYDGYEATPDARAQESAQHYRISEIYSIGNKAEMVTALLLGFPVVYAAGNHAVCAIEYVGKQAPLIVNSDGRGIGYWGSYDEILWNYQVFAVRSVIHSEYFT